MEENNDHKEEEDIEKTPLRKARKNRISVIKDDMDTMRQELKELRFIYKNRDANYEDMMADPEYKLLFEEGSFTIDDYELHDARMYPSWEQILERYEKRKGEKIPKEWKHFDTTVYVKEFFEDADKNLEELKEMKGGRHRLTPEKLYNDLPKTKQDLEKSIGENLTKIAAVVLTLGLIILYKYMISLGYVSQQVRMFIGVGFGVGFLAGAHFLLSKKSTLSTVLVCGGSAVLYYTLSLVYQEYHIITSKAQAFGVGLIITAIITFLAVFYNRKSLSIVALIGGFAMPFTLGIGIGFYNLFFAYNFFLNLIMLTIAFIKNWRVINYATFIISIVLLTIWYFMNANNTDNYQFSLFVYATLFYLTFYVIIILYNIKEENRFTRRDEQVFIINTLIFVVTGLFFLKNTAVRGMGKTVFFGFTGLFNLAYLLVLYKKPQISQRLKELLMFSTTVFITLAGFTKLNYIYVNTFWAIEAPVLLWLGIKYKEKALRNYSAYIMLGTLISMFYAWSEAYFTQEDLTFILNEGFWTGFISFSSVAATVILLKKVDAKEQVGILPKYYYIQLIGIATLIAGYLCGFFELLFHTKGIIGGSDFVSLIIGAYSMVYILAVRWIVHKEKMERLRVFIGVLMGIIVVSYPFFGHWSTLDLRTLFLDSGTFSPFGFHYVNVGLSVLLIYLLITDITNIDDESTENYTYVIWFMAIMAIVHATFEFEHTIVLLRDNLSHANIDTVLDQVRLTGWSALWSILAFIGVFLGMRYKIKELRLVALVLFGVTLFKFFAFDFWKLETLWKIISILLIGAIIGAVGMMYNKLKVIIIDGEMPILESSEEE